MTTERMCCYREKYHVHSNDWIECEEPAEFAIFGMDADDPTDMVDACMTHVGDLLGTPDGSSKQNTSWQVVELTGSD